MILVCFAVKEEARFFKPEAGSHEQVQTLLTGIGRHNAAKSIRKLLDQHKPRLVLSCGFAGGLSPDLSAGSVVFSVDDATGLERSLLAAGARPGRFYCVDRVATTAQQKRALWQATKADAVEMESQIICECCRGQTIPSGTVRVILDTAGEDLPLDFNEMMTADQRMDYAKLAMALVKSPGKVNALLRLQKQSGEAAQRMANVLKTVLNALSNPDQ
jgi:adenosylhomocysteine nucleosidase